MMKNKTLILLSLQESASKTKKTWKSQWNSLWWKVLFWLEVTKRLTNQTRKITTYWEFKHKKWNLGGQLRKIHFPRWSQPRSLFFQKWKKEPQNSYLWRIKKMVRCLEKNTLKRFRWTIMGEFLGLQYLYPARLQYQIWWFLRTLKNIESQFNIKQTKILFTKYGRMKDHPKNRFQGKIPFFTLKILKIVGKLSIQ